MMAVSAWEARSTKLSARSKRRPRLAQAELRAAGDGLGKLVVQACQLCLQALQLGRLEYAKLVRARHACQHASQIGIVVGCAHQRRKQRHHLLRQRRHGLLLRGRVPQQQ